MKLLKKMIIFILVVVIALEILIAAVPNQVSYRSEPTNVGIVFYRFDDPYVVELRKSLENIEKKNEGKVKFNFYDSKNDKAIQSQNIDILLESGSVDVLILSLVDLKNDPKEIISKIKDKNIPVIFVSKRTLKVDQNILESYDKAYYVVPDSEQAGRLQGEIVADLWNKNKDTIDTNKDDIMQYIMLQGALDNSETTNRTKYSIMMIKDVGIKVEELGSRVANWNEDMAREAMESLFIKYDGKIEVVIANNNAMAIGAVKTLQKYGYNKEESAKIIPVFGIDEMPEARELIKKGFMAGTVLQDPDVMADALYEVVMHLVNNVRLDCKEKYKCDESGRVIELPFKKYVG